MPQKLTKPTKPASASSPASPPKPTKITMPQPTRLPDPTAIPDASGLTVGPWTGEGEGEKIVIYGQSGMGKTTLASLAPSAVFIGLDDGARKLRHPTTKEPLHAIGGVNTFADLRAALHSEELLSAYKTVVIDTITMAEVLSLAWIFKHHPLPENQKATSIGDYDWGEGYTFLLDSMRLILTDCERIVRQGKNVVLLAQESSAVINNIDGADYWMVGPKLYHGKRNSCRSEVIEWADHVARLDFADTTVAVPDKKAKAGAIVTRDNSRVVHVAPERHYAAKSRTLDESPVSFSDPSDDSFWAFLTNA